MPEFDFSNYISPFTWRYGSKKMRYIFSENHKYELWRKIWIAIAKAQNKSGLISDQELANLEENKDNIDIEEIINIEKETQHDVVAAIKEFAKKATIGGGKIHLGMTSMDIVDNADAIRVKEALLIIEEEVKNLLKLFTEKIEKYAELICLGYTHLQPAEPTTVGYRFAFYAQDLLMDYLMLCFVKQNFLKGKGIKGAVGTQASFSELLSTKENDSQVKIEEMEKEIMNILGIEAIDISTQITQRKIDYYILTSLSGIAQSLAKFAGDVRILQSPSIGEWSEEFGEKQIGSSAMPFKKNPIKSEKICSLARLVASYPNVALENAAMSYLERTLDDSANRRVITPEAFLAIDEIIITSKKLISGLVINDKKIAYNLLLYAPFAATERIIVAAVKKGANRQEMHKILRDLSMSAWQNIQEGKNNSMKQLLLENSEVKKYLNREEIEKLLDVSGHIGTAVKRAKKFVEKINKFIA